MSEVGRDALLLLPGTFKCEQRPNAEARPLGDQGSSSQFNRNLVFLGMQVFLFLDCASFAVWFQLPDQTFPAEDARKPLLLLVSWLSEDSGFTGCLLEARQVCSQRLKLRIH